MIEIKINTNTNEITIIADNNRQKFSYPSQYLHNETEQKLKEMYDTFDDNDPFC